MGGGCPPSDWEVLIEETAAIVSGFPERLVDRLHHGFERSRYEVPCDVRTPWRVPADLAAELSKAGVTDEESARYLEMVHGLVANVVHRMKGPSQPTREENVLEVELFRLDREVVMVLRAPKMEAFDGFNLGLQTEVPRVCALVAVIDNGSGCLLDFRPDPVPEAQGTTTRMLIGEYLSIVPPR